ncbi:hypothetical protein LMG27174_06107 [Paraburkholderia rhynchosiae]|uniref:Uncharacterized protein n=1 Tax=Paraburkholderia rhynchosiae TaxID=487049 RepID=A0A6J5CFF5_9BURK|nr:hypothetical protein LMG27174_06107 [Paraburkholderia rhynchosiae]
MSSGINRHAIFFMTCCSNATGVDMVSPLLLRSPRILANRSNRLKLIQSYICLYELRADAMG